MPAWLRVIADWNPVSAVTAAARQLFGNPNPSAAIAAWPMQHPVPAGLGWSALILAVSVPLAPILLPPPDLRLTVRHPPERVPAAARRAAAHPAATSMVA